MEIKSSYIRNSNDKLTKFNGSLAALRIIESCSRTIKFTTELRNSEDVTEPPATITVIRS